ncbi:MAG: hypothetical protein HZB51_03185 [Chloroflexi bacterium]|nr:hypothetical protein [Chloroflexota bacterium]
MQDQKNDSTMEQSGNQAGAEGTPSAATQTEPLQLPLGAFIAYRITNGSKSNPHEIVVYPDGRVSIGGPDVAKQVHGRATRKLNDGQIARLRKMLDQVGFFRLPTPQTNPAPDARAHEIVARIGSRANHVKVFEGSIPDALTPLLQQLSALMPKE